LKGIIVKLITGKISKISPATPKAQKKSKLCKITIGETEVLLGKYVPKKFSVGDKLAALVSENSEEQVVCVAFRNITRKVNVPARGEAIGAWWLGGFAILFGIFVLLLPVTTGAGWIAIASGMIMFSSGFRVRRLINLLEAEIARQKSQNQENS
jgi:hypothetical protein